MIYSVYDYDKGRYRYFEGLAGTPATGFFRKARMASIKGSHVPESFAVPLPADARLVGEGPMPKGYIAEDPSGLAALPVPGEPGGQTSSSRAVPLWMVVGVAVIAFLVGRSSRRAP